jgi:hypothetical protein
MRCMSHSAPARDLSFGQSRRQRPGFSYRVVAKRRDIRAPRFESVQVSGEGPLAHARLPDLCSRQASTA